MWDFSADQEAFRQVLEEILTNTEFARSDVYIQHGSTSIAIHSIAVALMCLSLSHRLHVQVHTKQMIRGALLHDYFLYDWHDPDKSIKWHGFVHPRLALKNAEREEDLTSVERDIIIKHMFPLTPIPPKYIESSLICVADKICSVKETSGASRRSFLYETARREFELAKIFAGQHRKETLYHGFDGTSENPQNIQAV